MDCVVILNWKEPEKTIRCLQSILRLNKKSLKVILCDNGSNDHSVIKIETWLSKNVEQNGILGNRYKRVSEGSLDDLPAWPELDIVLIENKKNYGYAGGNNVGIKFALERGCEIIWVLNNDTEVAQDAYCAVRSAFQKDPCLGLAGSVLMDMSDRSVVQAYGGRINKITFTATSVGAGELYRVGVEERKIKSIDYVIGASMFLRSEMVEECGLLSEDYFLYFEEADYCYRLKDSKWNFGVVWESKVYHELGGSTSGGQSDLAQKLYIRNRALFCKKYYPARFPLFLLTLPIVWLKNILKGNKPVASYALKVMYLALRNKSIPIGIIEEVT